MCGDYSAQAGEGRSALGSPPHVRGLRGAGPESVSHPRITPACAGTTTTYAAAAPVDQDHPRMCGDYSAQAGEGRSALGSPPHVRGLRSFNFSAYNNGRITPACAGTTS